MRTRLRLASFDVLRCTDCTVQMLSEMPDDEGFQALYSAEYFNTRAAYYFDNPVWDPERGRNIENIASYQRALDRLQGLDLPGRSLLDVGCGLGIFLAMARDAGWDVAGVDTSEYAVREARQRFNIPMTRTDTLADAGLPAGAFDVITLWDSLEHFRDPIAQMREVFRLLKPGGVVLIDTPNAESLLRAVADLCYHASFGLFTYPVEKLYHRFHLFYFTPLALRRLLERAHLEVVAIEPGQIPVVKARGSRVEKHIVRAFSGLERWTGRAFELLALARKREGGSGHPSEPREW